MELDPRAVRFYRTLTLVGGVAYLVWWRAVDVLLPKSFNPLGSRLVVVAFCLSLYLFSFRVDVFRRNMSRVFSAAIWAVTTHYFYLFWMNGSDINWVVGTYIVLIAASAGMATIAELLSYSVLVLVLSGILVTLVPELLHTVFLSGVVTILVFAYLGLRPRLQLLARTRDSAERLQSLFDAAFEGIALHENGVIFDANESFARLLGYSHKEVLGRSVETFTAPESHALMREMLRSGTVTAYEVIGVRKDGTRIPLEINGKNHLLGGRTVRLTAVRDLTEHKRAEHDRVLYEAAQESLRVRDEFLLILSHELKTPITNIKLQTELARRNLARGALSTDPDRLRKLVDQTDKHANRLVRLIDDMVDLARIGMGEWPTEKQPCDLSQLVRTVVAAQSEALQLAGCPVRLEVDQPVVVMADPSRMEQVLVNLLTNAMKYGAGSEISITTSTRGSEAVLSVKDGGIGIAPEDQDRIFERFERAVSARHISGMGVGLFLCKFIVEAHGGRIELSSERGLGARFTVVLPLAAEDRSTPTKRAEQELTPEQPD